MGPGLLTSPLNLTLNVPQQLSVDSKIGAVVVPDAAWIFVVQNYNIRFKVEVPAGSDFTKPVPITLSDDGSNQKMFVVALPHEDGGEQRLSRKDCVNESGGFCQLCMVCYGCCLPPPSVD
jgi:hypothetical protein